MVKFIHKVTGCVMWVAEDKADEFRAVGHKPVVQAPAPEKKPTTRRKKK